MGTLYIVPTPIGNLEDITFRALRILKEVDCVLCEDTSVTQKLFKEYEINTKTSLFYAKTGLKNVDRIINDLENGKSFALVSDAGTPTISDPGYLLVSRLRKESKGVKIVSLPGASALTTALSSSGISSANFTFYGFLPHKKGRETIFKKIKESDETSVFYESVHRIEKTLNSLFEYLEENRIISVAREMTKIYEEVIFGTAKEVKDFFDKNKDHIRGEFVIIIEGRK